MRDILFRGKRVDGGEWVEGGFTLDASGKPRITVVDSSGFGLNFEKVRPETVGQFTGLLDKNDKRIFEGDKFEDEEGCFIVIEWIEDQSCFGGSLYGYAMSIGEGSQEVFDGEISCVDRNLYGVDDLTDYEIIGNIHENQAAT